jgi:cob(I)alamin adenosyltransferase
MPPLRRFILPGGSPAGSLLHLARTICRRAERRVVGLGADAVEPIVVVYLNRLSDLLFVMARAANHRAGAPETEW